MKNYEKYKPTGVEWLREIPLHWVSTRLKWVCRFEYGESLSVVDREEGDFPVYGSNGITGFHSSAISKAPCIIVGRKGSFGKINWSDKECFPIDTTYFIDESKTDKDLRWLYYVLQNLGLDTISKDTGVPGLNREDAYQNIVPLPESGEQTAIADYLDQKTAQIDVLIDSKQKLIELLKEKRTAIINHAVTRGNNPKAKLKPSGIEWLGDIPEHWEVKKLKYLIKKGRSSIKTGPFGSQIKNSDLVIEGPFKVYNQRNVLDNDFDKGEDFIEENKFDDLKDFEVFEGDVLFTTRGTIGKCAIFPSGKQRGVLHPCLIRVQFDDSKVDKEWIRLFVNQSSLFLENVMLLSNSTTIEVIYSYNLKEVYIPLPETIKEQNDILTQIEVETRRLDATISKIEKEIELLQEYRTALISEVVKGKIKVI